LLTCLGENISLWSLFYGCFGRDLGCYFLGKMRVNDGLVHGITEVADALPGEIYELADHKVAEPGVRPCGDEA
jgi:hypothetical protein